MRGLRAIVSVFRCRPCLLVQLAVLSGLLFISLSAAAQERKWYFEIEVILFEQLNAVDSLKEVFDEQNRRQEDAAAVDLITPYLSPDLSQFQGTLPLCDAEPVADAEALFLEQVSPGVFSPDPRLGQTPFDFDSYATEEMQLVQNAFTEYGFYEGLPHSRGQDNAQPQREFDDSQGALYTPDEERAIDTFALPDSPPVPPYLAYPLQSIEIPKTPWCIYTEERFPLPVFENKEDKAWYTLKEVPYVLDGVEWPYETRPYLLSRNSLRLKKLVRDIRRQKNLRPLLHMGWRQEVLFGRQNAPFYRLFAGENYAQQYAADGSPLLQERPVTEEPEATPDEAVSSAVDPLVKRIRDALSQDGITGLGNVPDTIMTDGNVDSEQQKVAELWQLGGLVKVYLQNINRVPYLHIDANMDYRATVSVGEGTETTTQLKTHNFRQLRRVISRQVHYFDHPLFGMVVQIRRYQRPTPPQPMPQ